MGLFSCGGGDPAEAAQPPGIRVKPSSIPSAPAGGVSLNAAYIKASADTPAAGPGDFRTFCKISHYGYDDPLVNQTPGTPNRSHLHTFWGNTDTNYNTDITVSPQTTGGNSTCRGGTLNRSRYWVPTMIDTRTGAVVQATGVHQYYKRSNITLGSDINFIPTNLRMVSGISTSTTYQGVSRLHFSCFDSGGTGTDYTNLVSASFGTCVAGLEMWMVVGYGQCLSTTLGVPDVDSSNHRDHHTDPSGGVCPGSHPYGIPGISSNVIFTVPTPASDIKYWRLASDTYTGPGGYSIHGDFAMGWDTNLHKSWVNGCNKQNVSCFEHLVGLRDENDNVIGSREIYGVDP